MSVVIALPLIGLLVALPGLPRIPGLPGFGLKDLKKLRQGKAPPLDSLPPAWKPASRLGLENQFIIAMLPSLGPRPVALKLNPDPRKVRVGLDPDSGTVRYVTEMEDVPVGDAARVPIDFFARDLTRRNFSRIWNERSLEYFRAQALAAANQQTPATASGTGLKFELPSPLPKRFQGLLGPGGPSLTVTGSENIRLSGQSNWTNQQLNILGQRNSLFPSLDMQQDLNIRLEGRLSDRVGVNLLQNSANQIPLANRVAINYVGDEDDLVQSLDLGNTNLTLPGTQYVSYSGKNEGLFGMKATSRLGPLDFTVLASKQEGRSERASYAGGAARQPQSLEDKDYVRGVYFFLYDPNLPGGGLDVREINESTVRLYLDEGTNINQVNIVRGRAYVDPENACLDAASCPDGPDSLSLPDTTRAIHGSFRELRPGADADYEILSDVYGPFFKVIRLRSALTIDRQALAVTYDYRRVVNNVAVGESLHVGGRGATTADGEDALTMKLIRAPQNELEIDPQTYYYLPSPFDATRELELRNFYQLAGQGIDPATFTLRIRQGNDNPPIQKTEKAPYFQVVGLDNLNETGGFQVQGHDEKVDGVAPDPRYRVFVDFKRGTLWLPDIRPFAPRLADDATGKPFDRLVSRALFRDDSLVGAPGTLNAANPVIYDKRSLLPQDRLYSIDLDFTAARVGSEISLGRSNIIEGSDVVTVSGQVWKRDVDYRVDYDLGRITLIRQLRPEDQLNIDYSYAPLFQQAGKTLIGNAFRWEGRDRNFGGAFLYESKGAQDLRPRLGEEPSRTLIGDLNTEFKTKPFFLTRLVDLLPGVRTSQPSEFNIQAEVGASFPNPNTRNEIFLDDMEGVRDAVTLSMSPERWRWASVPKRGALPIDQAPNPQKNAEIRWYSPLNAVKERELKPSLTQAQGSQNTRQVLAWSIPRRPTTITDPFQPLWVGLTQPIDNVGIDLSRSQFLEIWVNDFRDHHNGVSPVPRVRGRNIKLHIDLGTVDEDAQRAPDQPPNQTLDTEDRPPRDGQLSVVDEDNEDTGLDGVLSSAEPGPPLDLVTAHPGDPQGDDFELPNNDFEDWDPRKWRRTNGTEADKNVVQTPETEDLNLNGRFDQENDYFEYTIVLGDTAGCDSCKRYLVSDIHEAFPGGYADGSGSMNSDNGWRRYRIPIADSLRVQFGSPDLTLARHVRIWLEGILETDPPPRVEPSGDTKGDGRPFLAIGGVEIVGSRWLATDLDAASDSVGTTLTLNSVNSVDQADIYVPPFDPGTTRSGSQELERREQSLALEFTKFGPSDTIEAYKTFSIDEDYTRYGSLDWFTAAFDIPTYDPATDTLDYFLRFGSDERGLNYYEYRARLPSSSSPQNIAWREVKLALTQLSNLKLNEDFPVTGDILYQAPGAEPGEQYTIRGRPSFTRIRRLSFGVINASTRTYSGQVWLDELRALDVAKDAGNAKRVNVNGRMANLLSYNLGYNDRDANFLSVGESRGSGNSNNQMTFSTAVELHRFFESTRILLPFSYSYAGSRSSPRFTAGDDVVRTGALAEASDSRGKSQSWSLSYSRAWNERTHPLLRYTIGGITANYNRSWSDSRNPINVNDQKNSSLGVNYTIAPRQLLALKVPGTALRFFPLPERFFANYAQNTNATTLYDRERDSLGSVVLRSRTRGNNATIDFGTDTRPFDFFHHGVTATRNLSLPAPLLEKVSGLNLGRVVRLRQNLDGRIAFQKYGPWLRPTMAWRSDYDQQNGLELSPDMSVRAVRNQQAVSLDWELPFDRLVTRGVTGAVTPGRSVASPGLPGAPAAKDTTQKARGTGGWRMMLSRLGAISTSFSYNTSNSQSRVLGTPSPLYLLGLSNNFGDLVSGRGARPAFGNVASDGSQWNFRGRTALDLGMGAILATSGNINDQSSNSNGVERRSTRIAFPDLDLSYGSLPRFIGMNRFFENPRIKTRYSRSQSIEYINQVRSASQISTVSDWSPLLEMAGDLKNGTRTQLTVNRRVTQSENRQNGHSLTTERNLTANFNMNRSYSKGQKVSILGKETTVKSNINLGMSAVYEKQSGETVQQSFGVAQSETNHDRLSVNANGGYSFSNNVSGSLEVGYGQNRNLVTKIVTRSIRLELRAQFTF
jgi:hypothetical protein